WPATPDATRFPPYEHYTVRGHDSDRMRSRLSDKSPDFPNLPSAKNRSRPRPASSHIVASRHNAFGRVAMVDEKEKSGGGFLKALMSSAVGLISGAILMY